MIDTVSGLLGTEKEEWFDFEGHANLVYNISTETGVRIILSSVNLKTLSTDLDFEAAETMRF